MNKKIILAIILIILFTIGYLLINNNDKKNDRLLNPNYKKVESSVLPTIIPSPTPKTFKFYRNTDLKKELESINPEVLDSDFE